MSYFKKITSVLLVGVMLFGLTACSESGNSNQLEENKAVLSKALDKLKEDEEYIISTSVNAPDGDVYYLTVNTKDGCYTEYPVDSDGNYGTLSYGEVSDNQQYVLTDYWVDSSNSYFLNTEDGETLAYKYPAEYSKELQSRGIMYFDEMLENFTSIKFKETKTADIGNGDEDLKIYECELPSEYMHDFFGKTSLALYEAILKETDNDNMKNLCKYYLDEYDMTLTFSNANVFVGIDNTGKLKYVDIMVGGLGSKMYMVMSILENDFTARTTPDFSNALKYTDSIAEVANFVAQYDSIEEGFDALSQKYSSEGNSEVSDDSDK